MKKDISNNIESMKVYLSGLVHTMDFLIKNGGHRFYKKKYNYQLILLDKNYKVFSKLLQEQKNDTLTKNLAEIDASMKIVLGDNSFTDKINEINKIPKFWNTLEVELDNVKNQVSDKIEFKVDKLPIEIAEEVCMDLEESKNCINAIAYRSSIIMAARSLEVCLHRKYFEHTGMDLLGQNLSVGKLIGKLKDQGLDLQPGVNDIFNLANDCRIHSVHKKKGVFKPKDTDALSILHLVNNSIGTLW